MAEHRAASSFRRRARDFWDSRQRQAAEPGYSGYLLDESPPSLGRHRFEGEWAQLTAWLRRHPIARGRCLDVGCGTGAWTLALAGRFERVEGWDYAPSMAAAARARLRKAGAKNAVIRCGDPATRPGKALFDLIFVGGVLMYTPESRLRPLLKALRRLLKPGGLLVLRETTTAGPTWVREGLALRPGLMAAGGPPASADYVAIYRSPEHLRRALQDAGLAVLHEAANPHYKLSDLTEDWLRRLNTLSLGRLRRHPSAMALAAEALHRLRYLLLYPEYLLRRWRLINRWSVCAQAPRTSSTWKER